MFDLQLILNQLQSIKNVFLSLWSDEALDLLDLFCLCSNDDAVYEK